MKKPLSLFLGVLVFDVIPAEVADLTTSLLGKTRHGEVISSQDLGQVRYSLKIDNSMQLFITELNDNSEIVHDLPVESPIIKAEDIVFSDIVLDSSCTGCKLFKSMVPKVLVLTKDGTLAEYLQKAWSRTSKWYKQPRGKLTVGNPKSDKWKCSFNGDEVAQIVEEKMVRIYDKECNLLCCHTFDDPVTDIHPQQSSNQWLIVTGGKHQILERVGRSKSSHYQLSES